MRIKQRPEDFSVKESYRFDEVAGGRFRVYLMDKQKLSTFDAVDRLREAFGLKPGSISYCGLKDKQGRTEQLIAVDGADVDMQEPDLRLKYLGPRGQAPVGRQHHLQPLRRHRARARAARRLTPLNVAAAEVNRLGVVNYFDSQRFGSLKHGQGFIAKDLIRGDFEAALRNYLAQPSELDRTEDAKVKAFWRENWGQWDARVPFEGSRRSTTASSSPCATTRATGVRAFLQIDSAYRAMLLFTYQSYLWNEGVRRYLQLLLPREHLFPMPYQAGTLLFHRDAAAEVMRTLRDATFPLLAPDSQFKDPQVKQAVEWVLGREKLEPRAAAHRGVAAPALLQARGAAPRRLPAQAGRRAASQEDDLNRDGSFKVNIAFTLPPGAYATLVVKRLFHFEYREDNPQEIRDSWRTPTPEGEEGAAEDLRPSRPSRSARRSPDAEPAPTSGRRAPSREPRERQAPSREPRERQAPSREPRERRAAEMAPPPAPPPAAEPAAPVGFRERQRQKKGAREQARQEQVAQQAAAKQVAKPSKTRKKK